MFERPLIFSCQQCLLDQHKSRVVHPRSRLRVPITAMRPSITYVLLLLTASVAKAGAACPHGSVPCKGRQSCAPRGGACIEQKCVGNQGGLINCVKNQDTPESFHTRKLPRALRHSAAALHGAKPGRRLLQLAGVGNFLVGAGVAGFQRAINAAGAATQLANFYGIEGLGLRHRMGALPAPGGLAVMALAGPAAMPGPTGFTIGWIGGTLEALAASANPLSVAAAGAALEDLAGSQGIGQIIGADGLSGLGLGTGLAASAGLQALNTEGLSGGGPLQAAGNLLQKVGLPVGGGLGGGGGVNAKQRKASGVAAGLEAMSKVLGGASNMAGFAGNAIRGMQKESTNPVTIERTVTYGNTGDSMLGNTADLSSYSSGGYSSTSVTSQTSLSGSGSLGGFYSNTGPGMGSISYDASMSSVPTGSFTTSSSMPVSSGSSYSTVGSPMTSDMYSGSSQGVPVSSSSLMGSNWGQSSQGSMMGATSYPSVGGQAMPMSALG